MLKLIGYLTSIFLISIIFLRMPQKTTGLSSFTTSSSILGSPSSARRILNILTAIGIIIYLGIAVTLNFFTF